MSNSTEDPMLSDDLPEMLTQRIDPLELPELRSLLSYIDQRIESLRTPIEAEIEANATGEILEIENHGSYALVRKHPPNPDGSGALTDIISLYHVRREQQLDGAESQYWAYVGEAQISVQIRCEICEQTFEQDIDAYPNCESDDVVYPETKE